jgi:hypothetical protein
MPRAIEPRSADHVSRTLLAWFAVICASAFLIVVRPRSIVFDKPLDEDGYYALSIARHLGLGRGLTYDGNTLTNGFQPLWVILCAPLMRIAGGDRVLAVRLVLAIHWFLFCASAGLTAVLARRVFAGGAGLEGEEGEDRQRRTSLIAAFAVLTAPQWWMNAFNGLETSLVVTVMLAILVWYVSLDEHSRWRLIACGAALGALVLARVDAAIFVVLLAAARLFRSASMRRRAADALSLSAPAFVVSLPWWAYNYFYFGHLTPTSGRALQDWAPSPGRYWAVVAALVRSMTPHVYLSRFENDAVTIVRLAILAAVMYLVWRPLQRVIRRLDRATVEALAALALFNLALAAWYATSSWATLFFIRYLATSIIVASLFWTLVFVELFARIRRAATQAAIILAAAQVPLFVAMSYRANAFSGHTMLREQVPLVQANVPAEDWVAAIQSGTLGFLRDRVVNLDGRVNAEALSRQGDLEAYLRERHIRWFVDWQDLVPRVLGATPEQRGWSKVGSIGRMALYRWGE